MYVLNLDENNRVLSAGKELEGIDYTGQILVEELPDLSDGKWTEDYIYNGDGTYTYDPVERPPAPEPAETTDDVLNTLIGWEEPNNE